MSLQLSEKIASHHPPPHARVDRLARGGILAAGLLCLLLLAWGHLGLGAWLVPPAPTVAQQQMVAGPYTLTLRLESGQLTARGPNNVLVRLQDHAGHPITGARLHVALEMTSMPMHAPDVEGLAQGAGQYLIHPVFAMAGDWRLVVTISAPGQSTTRASFPVGVRWS